MPLNLAVAGHGFGFSPQAATLLRIASGDPSRTSRVFAGQVTTATPAGLDFRAAEAAGEGFADAMSAQSDSSMRRAGERS